MKYLFFFLLPVLVGCVDLFGDSSQKEDLPNPNSNKPSVELTDVDGRFLSSTYRNAIIGRTFSEDDYSGTWIMVGTGYANSNQKQESFLARKIMNVKNRIGLSSTEMNFSNSCMYEDFTFNVATRELVNPNISGLQEFQIVDESYFYYVKKKDNPNYSDIYEKFEYIKLSDDQLNIGSISEHIVNANGEVLLNATSDILCYSESERLAIGSDYIRTFSDFDIDSDLNSEVSLEKPVTIYGPIYLDGNIFYLSHKSVNNLAYEANENEGAEASIAASIMDVVGATEITLDAGGIASSQFEVSLSNILSGE